jgi:hypothetical protein
MAKTIKIKEAKREMHQKIQDLVNKHERTANVEYTAVPPTAGTSADRYVVRYTDGFTAVVTLNDVLFSHALSGGSNKIFKSTSSAASISVADDEAALYRALTLAVTWIVNLIRRHGLILPDCHVGNIIFKSNPYTFGNDRDNSEMLLTDFKFGLLLETLEEKNEIPFGISNREQLKNLYIVHCIEYAIRSAYFAINQNKTADYILFNDKMRTATGGNLGALSSIKQAHLFLRQKYDDAYRCIITSGIYADCIVEDVICIEQEEIYSKSNALSGVTKI